MPVTCACESTFPAKALASKIGLSRYPLLRASIAEFCGTAIMIIFGCGVIAQVRLGVKHGREHGTFGSVAWNWGMAVMLGVFFAGSHGHGLINPAVTLGFTLIGKLSWIRLVCYTVAQLMGAIFGALVVWLLNLDSIREYAQLHDAGLLLMNSTGDIFVTRPTVSTFTCFLDQMAGTALLTAGALVMTDKRTWKVPEWAHPLFLGLLVFSLVNAYTLNAGCALNPARDLGPRILIVICGWKSAFTADHYYFWVPIAGPYLGAVIGAFLYEISIGLHVDELGSDEKSDIELAGQQ